MTMTTLNDIDTTNAVAATVATPADTLMLAAKLVAKTVAKIAATDNLLADQQLAVQAAKQKVSDALAGNGNFDDAGRVFKAANNKLDKLLETREALVSNANADLDAVRDQIAAVQAQLRALDA
ncbi:MAG TPA: hypothetical protein DEF44_14225 [Pseudomonas sp.]|nr:hypothetical protein [Pseudomonas sp.]